MTEAQSYVTIPGFPAITEAECSGAHISPSLSPLLLKPNGAH